MCDVMHCFSDVIKQDKLKKEPKRKFTYCCVNGHIIVVTALYKEREMACVRCQCPAWRI